MPGVTGRWRGRLSDINLDTQNLHSLSGVFVCLFEVLLILRWMLLFIAMQLFRFIYYFFFYYFISVLCFFLSLIPHLPVIFIFISLIPYIVFPLQSPISLLIYNVYSKPKKISLL